MRSAFETADTDVQFIFYVDDDDPTAQQTCDIAYRESATVITGPRIMLSEAWNRCADHAQYPIMMHCGDDIIFRTSGWDRSVLDAFDRYDDKIVFIHGNDLYQGNQIGTHGFLHRRWVNAVGYMVPPYFSSDYNDLWLTEVADVLGRRCYLPDVVTEHMHPVIGKGEWDVTHQERLERHQRDDVASLYATLADHRRADVAKLQAVIDEYTG